jgi:RNA polymerase sigma-70 factor (ECF subfamily)
MIPSTHLSLLAALKDPGKREAAWGRFQRRYEEIILRWCLRRGLQQADAEDVTQTVLTRLFGRLPEHRHDPSRPFRSWLKAVVQNAIRDLRRAGQRHPADRGVGGSSFLDRLANLEGPESLGEVAEALAGVTDPDLEAAVQRVRARVAEATWQAFWRQAVDGLPAAEVAAQLGMSIGSVFQAKYRVVSLLGEEYQGRGGQGPQAQGKEGGDERGLPEHG